MTSHLLVITGSMGAGKTAVLGEASDLLSAARIPHAAIDLDAFGVYHSAAELPPDAVLTNLAAVWKTFTAAGIGRLLLAEALESVSQRDELRARLMPEQMTVCRLRAPVQVMEARVRARETGILQEVYVNRVGVLEQMIDDAGVEDFAVMNDRRSMTDVAREVLSRAAWL